MMTNVELECFKAFFSRIWRNKEDFESIKWEGEIIEEMLK